MGGAWEGAGKGGGWRGVLYVGGDLKIQELAQTANFSLLAPVLVHV